MTVGRRNWIWIASTALTICLAVGVYAFGWKDAIAFVFGQTMAAWVQAFGSIGAIVGAYGLARRQGASASAERRLHQAERRLELTDVAIVVATDVKNVLTSVCDRLEGNIGALVPMPWERLEELQYTMRTLVAKDVSTGVLRTLLEIQRELSYTLTAARQLKIKEVTQPRLNSALFRLENVSKKLTELQEIRRLQVERVDAWSEEVNAA